VPFTAETFVRLPQQFKNVLRSEFQGVPISEMQILDGDSAYVAVNGVPQSVEPRLLREMRAARFADNAATLVPLLADASYKVTALKEQPVKGRPAVGILVQYQGQPDYRMYFDKASGLLVKTERRALNYRREEARQEAYFDDYRATAGITRPMRFTLYQDGQLVSQGEITEVRYPGDLPADTFTAPR
jgi:hypothetical protein